MAFSWKRPEGVGLQTKVKGERYKVNPVPKKASKKEKMHENQGSWVRKTSKKGRGAKGKKKFPGKVKRTKERCLCRS